jgi:hypothetical protein
MVRTQVSFEPKMYKAAQAEARRLGISLAELCRRALARTLSQNSNGNSDPWMRFSGAIEGHPDESRTENIDSVVYGKSR